MDFLKRAQCKVMQDLPIFESIFIKAQYQDSLMIGITKQNEQMLESRNTISKQSSFAGFNAQINGSHKRSSSLENTRRLSLEKSSFSLQRNQNINSPNNIDANKIKLKEEMFLFNPPRPYLGGNLNHKVFINIKPMSFEQKNMQSQDTPVLQIIDQQTIKFTNKNIDPKKKKIVQKEKNYTFDYIQGENSYNFNLQKKAITPAIQKFIAGTNQSILIFGGQDSGKAQTLYGGIRDPGIFVLSLEEIFGILYKSQNRENTTLKMSMYYSYEQYFYDLLVDHNYPHKLYQKESGEVFPLGISEVIITSLKTALKIYKIGIDRIEKNEFAKREANIIFTLKCEKSENILIGQDTTISYFKIVKTNDKYLEELTDAAKDEGLMINLMKCLRMMSKMINNKKNMIIPFRKHIFTEYLRESIVGNSSTSVICCLSKDQQRINETANILRLANSCKRLFTNPKEVKYQISKLTTLYNDLLENIGNAISIWVKEFWGDFDKTKEKRMKMIFKILKQFENFMFNLLDGLEQQIQIDLIKNALYGKILDNHCHIYSQSITSEDIKEFYVAKIQIYAQKQMQDKYQQIYPTIHFVLNQLEQNKEKIIRNKSRLCNYFKQFFDAKKLSLNDSVLSKEQASLLTPKTKITPIPMININSLTNLDIEKMGFLQKLFSKFQESCENLIENGLYIPQNVRKDVIDCLKDYKLLEKILEEENEYQSDDNNMNTSYQSFRFNSQFLRSKARGSTFKLQHDIISRSRVNSQYQGIYGFDVILKQTN